MTTVCFIGSGHIGDDPQAKAAVAAFLDRIGCDIVDAGPLGTGGRRFQVDTPAYAAPYGTYEHGTPVSAAALRTALAAA